MSTGMAGLRKSLVLLSRLMPVLLLISILACRDEACPSFETKSDSITLRDEACPSFETKSDSITLRDEVTLHPKLVEATIEAIRMELKDPYTIEQLEIEEAGEATQVTVSDTGSGNRLTDPRHKLGGGRELYYSIHLWGWAAFEDGSEISFQVWVNPVPSGGGCEIQGASIRPSSFIPI